MADDELISLIGKGQRQASEELWRRHGDDLFHYVRSKVGKERAPAVIGGVCLKIVQSAQRYDPHRGLPRQWLFQVTKSVIADSYRAEARERTVSYDPTRLSVLRSKRAGGPVGDFAGRVIALRSALDERGELYWLSNDDLARATRQLPHMQRQVIELLYWRNLSPAEVAERLETKEQRVYENCSRALATLKERLSALGHESAGSVARDYSRKRKRRAPVLAERRDVFLSSPGAAGLYGRGGVMDFRRSRYR
jgi:RNA polymerase sigma factor (sigma-70 family)